jgi:histone deacetylase 1/2
VSFIDDYSKFTWIYLLKYKYEVFHKFQEFQTLVERLFNRAMQTDWGGEYQKLIPSLIRLGLYIVFLVHMLINKMELPKENIATL